MEEEFKNQNILGRDLVDEMEESYLSYAMSVIISRALPDVRDGLKPVHRRVLYGASGIGAQWNRKHKKSARIVGEVIGKYHPHGDQSIYDSLVRMAQPWSLRYLLIDGQGNFGSVDGDGAAAMRYTEAKMSKIASEMLKDIEKETVSYQPNRAVFFSSNICHFAEAPSNRFSGLRVSVAWKLSKSINIKA